MTAQIIPLLPKYADDITTELEGIAWAISYRWNKTYGAWFADLSSTETGTTLLGLCLIGGSNILQPHAVTELGMLFMVDTSGLDCNPDFDSIGDRFKLVYIPKADIL